MEATQRWNTVFIVIEFVVCLLGFLFNGLVILTICKNISRLSPSSYLILSIAVSDFLSCSIAFPFSIAAYFQGGWPYASTGCKAHAFMVFLFALVSITHLAIISAGKYLTISHSLTRQFYFGKNQILLAILAAWIYSFGFSLAPLVGWSRYGLEGTNATCSIVWDSTLPGDKAYFGVIFVACYFLPMGVITFCYYKIHMISKNIVGNARAQMGGHIAMTMTQALAKRHRKSALYFLIVIVAYMLSWTPYAIVSLLVVVVGKRVNAAATSACSVFAKTSFMMNPILYAIFFQKFRRQMVIVNPITIRQNQEVRPVNAPSHSQPFAL